MVKNLLFVAKVIYLISPESEITPAREVEEEGGEEEEMENGGERENDDEGEKADEEKEEEKQEEEDEKDDRPPSLLWMMKKLSLMAKRETTDTPKIPLKVSHKHPNTWSFYIFSQHHCLLTDGELKNISNKWLYCYLSFLSPHREHVCLSSWGP